MSNQKLPYQITVFNVGQGDHHLLHLPNGHFGLIDFHFDENLQTKLPVLAFFEDYKRTFKKNPVIDFLHVTHFDSDHIKGLEDLLNWCIKEKITIHEIWLSAAIEYEQLVDIYKSSKKGRELIAAGRSKGQNVHESVDIANIFRKLNELNRPQKLLSGIDTNFTELFSEEEQQVFCLAPLVEQSIKFTVDKLSGKPNVRNQASTILHFKYGKNRFMFGGDAEIKKTWNKLFKKYKESIYGSLESNFIKAPHHGAQNGTSYELWEKLVMKEGEVHIVFSAGKDSYPQLSVLKDINDLARDTKLYATNDNLIKKQKSEGVIKWIKRRDKKAFEQNTNSPSLISRSSELPLLDNKLIAFQFKCFVDTDIEMSPLFLDN